MSKRTLIFIIIAWCLLILIEYYFLPYFIVVLLWLGLSIVLFIVALNQLVKLIKERKALTKLRIVKVIIFSALFYLTLNRWFVNGWIEKIDWKIFYNKRMNIVEQVKRKELNPNVSWNTVLCELPFEFPVISNGGNDIMIFRNKTNESVTVQFWVFRNLFSAPSTCFVYTNDKKEIIEIEKLIANQPDNNWKIRDNWYRTFRE